MLLAVAAEFRPVAAAAVSFRLDEYARVMFDAAAERDGGATSHRLAALLTGELRFRTDESTIEGLWLDRVLDRRASGSGSSTPRSIPAPPRPARCAATAATRSRSPR
jgi:hypothetical protein